MKSKNQLPSATLIELMEKQRFGVEYQPIICIESQKFMHTNVYQDFLMIKIWLSTQI
jgi:hypothetical protein